ncbi:hypothetical protein Tco_0759411 [Tanacetum coccineum]
MDGRGVGSYVMLGSAPSGPSFSVSPLVKLSVAGRGEVVKGGYCVLIPDLVFMEKVGASDFRVLLLLIVEMRILEKKLIGLRLLVKNQKSIYSRKQISDKRMKNQAKMDKIKHGMEKREKTKSNRSQSQQKSKSTPPKSTVKADAGNEEYLMGPPAPI